MLPFLSVHRFRSPLFPQPLLLLLKPLSSFNSQQPPVSVFWDLDNKPPNSIPPYDAAVRLRLAASSFGPLRFIAAYANSHAFRHVPAPVRQHRSLLRSLHRLHSSHLCCICGRCFLDHSRLINHFKQIHQRENTKRLNRLNSARGARRVRLAAALQPKIEKYAKVARETLVPAEGYSLSDELKRAGVLVRVVDDRPESADRAMRAHMVDEMDKGRIGCLVVVSDDNGFVEVVREARMRCLMTVVIGDEGDGALRRCADAVFSWRDVVMGKARKAAGKEVGRWKDRDLLKRLEWSYKDEEEGGESEWDEFEEEGVDVGLNLAGGRGDEPWWKLDADLEDEHVQGRVIRSKN